ncbi:PLP-dependent transferase [Aureobasidium pullulans]|nr:PLP-dependent transferase [Aureobasidium pullulans]TIA09377.1 PLP-dependent transferase [Aureobasidium pullulans]
MAQTFDVTALRKHFPALDKKQVYFDNAGGSQVIKEVIDSVSEYLSGTNVQLGASYPVAQKSTNLFAAGKDAVAKYINANSDEVVLGPSTTQLFRNLSLALYEHLTPGSEIILSKLDHEANVASWLQMAEWRNLTVKWWDAPDKQNPKLEPSVLKSLLSEKTKLVCCTHTSNILGTISDIKQIAKTVHTVPGALLCIDAVAYAPHRQVDMRDLDVDFYCFSWYKVYGPHIAMLYAKQSSQSSLQTLGHYFKGSATLEDKLGLAAANYELTASIPKVCEYLSQIPWDAISGHEEKLQGILIDYLNSRSDVKIWGEPVADAAKRVPVISWTVDGRSSKDIVDAVEAKSDFGFRWGAFYSNRLVQEVMGLDPVDGVVRVSLVHYNTEDEIKQFVKVLDEVLSN